MFWPGSSGAREIQVVAIGDGLVYVYYDVSLVAASGSVRVNGCLSRSLSDRAALAPADVAARHVLFLRWSVHEMGLSFFLNNCVPSSFKLGLCIPSST